MQPGCAWPRQSKTSSVGQHTAALSIEQQEPGRPRHFPLHSLLPWQVATPPAAGQGLGKQDKAVQPGPVPPSGGLQRSPCSQELEHMVLPFTVLYWHPRAPMQPFSILILQILRSRLEAHTSLAPLQSPTHLSPRFPTHLCKLKLLKATDSLPSPPDSPVPVSTALLTAPDSPKSHTILSIPSDPHLPFAVPQPCSSSGTL